MQADSVANFNKSLQPVSETAKTINAVTRNYDNFSYSKLNT